MSNRRLENLNKKRKTQDEIIPLDTTDPNSTRQTTQQLINQLYNQIQNANWPYKHNTEIQQLRDKALIATFIISGLRASEALQGPQQTSGWKWKDKQKIERVTYKPNSYPLKFKQIKNYPERIIIYNAQTVKHGYVRAEIVFPKNGALGTITQFLDQWINKALELGATENSYLFPKATIHQETTNPFNWKKPLSTKRAWQIIYVTTGKFTHWYRAVSETIYGRVIFKNDAYALKQRMGLKTLEATTPYVQGNFKELEKRAEQL